MRLVVAVFMILASGSALAQEPKPNDSREQDALSSVQNTRGGRHWVDQATELPKSPEDSLSCFQIEPGLQVQLVAAEPFVMDPVSIAFDEFGRMFVAEYGDYPTGPAHQGDPPLSRIVMLLDNDGDGRMDQRHVFADQLDFAHSMMPYRGGLLVCTQNEIIFFKDTDGDHKADLSEVYFKGFTPAHSQMHIGNPRWGMDNWIYFNQGPGKIQRLVRSTNQLEETQLEPDPPSGVFVMPRQEFRFHPVTMEFGPASGLGQFGNTIDNFGHRFFSTNRNPIMEAPISYEQLRRNSFAVFASDHYDVSPSGGDSKVYPLVDMKSNYLSHSGTHTAACGTTAYRGDLLGPKFENSVFVCEPIGYLVTRSIIESTGVTLTAQRARPKADFLASTDTWFRPASLATGPDGALYIADMYRLWVEHPKFVPEDVAKRMDFRAGDDRGRIWRVVPEEGDVAQRGFVPPKTTDDLVGMLSDRNGWRRHLAQRLLVERSSKDAAAQLRQLLQAEKTASGKSAFARLHALWTLDGIGELNEADLIDAFDDSDVHVRRDAVSLSARFLKTSASLVERLLKLADDPDQRVRFQVALALGESGDPRATVALTRLALRDGGVPWFATAILTSVKQRAGWVLAGMVASTTTGQDQNQWLITIEHKQLVRDLASVVGSRGDFEELELVFKAIPEASKIGRWWQMEVLNGLANGLRRHRGKLGRTNLASLLATPPNELAQCVVPVIRLLDQSQMVAVDPNIATEDRVAAIELSALRPTDSSIKIFESLLGIDQPLDVQLASLAAMQGSGDDAANVVLNRWATLGVRVRQPALDLLFRRVDSTILTLEAMRAGKVNPAIVSIDRRVLFLQHRDATIKSLATELFGGAVSQNRREVANQYARSLTLPASAEKGLKVFDQSCAKCHRKDGRGFEVGPDISDVRNRSREALLHDILDPNQKIEPRFSAYLVVTADGRFFNGLMISETAESVILRLAEHQQQVIARDEIAEIRSSGKSLMPEGIEKEITVEQMAHLLEYLKIESSTQESD